jgi:hypothetical protein
MPFILPMKCNFDFIIVALTIMFNYMNGKTRSLIQNLKLSRRIRVDVVKSSRAINYVSVQLKINVSEISSVSIIRVDIVTC